MLEREAISESPKKLGEIIKDLQFARNTQIRDALEEQTSLKANLRDSFKIGQLLLFKKIITKDQLFAALRAQQRLLQEQAAKNERARRLAQADLRVSTFHFRDRLRAHLSQSPVLAWFRSLYR